MRKRFGFLATMVMGLVLVSPHQAAASDYTPELRAFMTTLSEPERDRFDSWWSRMPSYFKDSLHESRFEDWRAVIYCDFLGFRAGTPQSEKCVAMRNQSWQQNASQWNADGSFRGPSPACVARNETDEFGRLICVSPELQKQVQEYWDSLPKDQKLKEFSRPGHFWEAMQHCYEDNGYAVGSEDYTQCEMAYSNRGIPMN